MVGVAGEDAVSAPLAEEASVGVASPSIVDRGESMTLLGVLGAVMLCVGCVNDARLEARYKPSSGGVRKAELGEGKPEPFADR